MHIQTEKRTQMSSNPFNAFIDLISLDQEIRTIHEKMIHIKKETNTIQLQKDELTGRLQQFKQHVHDLQKQVNQQERKIKEFDEQEQAKKKQLDHIKKVKEYQPIKKEIDYLKQMQHETENQLMAIWNKLEIAQKEITEQKKQYTIKADEFDNEISNKNNQILLLEKELEEKQRNRPQKEIGIPNEWLEKYTHMRLRVADPVVPVMYESCTACSYTIPNQELLRLKRKALVQCKGCFRLLFMQEAMQEDNQDSK